MPSGACERSASTPCGPSREWSLARLIGLVALAIGAAEAALADPATSVAADDPRIARAWRLLRIVDCARCHGKSYEGLVAPSIVRYAATQDRETFVRMLLDGDPQRGMPGYRSNAYVAQSVDDIVLYFAARANGDIAADYRPAIGAERE